MVRSSAAVYSRLKVSKFEKSNLKKLKKADLQSLAEYYGLETKKSMKKGELVNLVWNYINSTIIEVKQEEELPPMSVRIKRIYKASKGAE